MSGNRGLPAISSALLSRTKLGQQLDQLGNRSEWLGHRPRIELGRQCLGALRRHRQPLPGDAEGTCRPLLVTRNMDFEAPHHLIAMDRRLNVLVVQQKPKLNEVAPRNGSS